ncbi:MAG: hypothetical protein PF518_10015, partial [Spirochaetaceae bacterium]|nr:hypothetical protein [Spirochaetaceae bacterium]
DLNPTAVWDSTYNAVWHLGENGTTFNDSTSSGNTGTGGSAPLTSPLNTAGKTGFGESFTSITDSIGFPPSLTLNNPGPVTYSGWFYNGATGGNLLFSKKYILLKRNGPNVLFEILQNGSDLYVEENDGFLATNTWVYLTISWDGISADTTGIDIYNNGDLYSGAAYEDAGSGTKLPDNSGDFYLGAYDTVDGQSLVFKVDEFRISNIVRSADWIKAQYLSQNDQFITFGSEEKL